MGNRPQPGYNYSRPGVAMVTLKARAGVRLCQITPAHFLLSAIGRVAQEELASISRHYAQVKIGAYQIMPDHLHALVHVTRALPAGVTLRQVVRGYKIGVDRRCREQLAQPSFQVFEDGLNDRLVFDRDHLAREVAYVRDNVRRYRLRQANAQLFQQPQPLTVPGLPAGLELWGVGNLFLLEHPQRVRVQLSRRTTVAQWQALQEELSWRLAQGQVFVSPFVSPAERAVLHEVVARGGRAIRLAHEFFGARHKPMGELFDLCCAGRLLELSVAREFTRYARLDWAACQRLNEVAALLAEELLAGSQCLFAGTQCPQTRG